MPQLDYTTYIAIVPNIYISWLSMILIFYLLLPSVGLQFSVLQYKKYQIFLFVFRLFSALNTNTGSKNQ